MLNARVPQVTGLLSGVLTTLVSRWPIWVAVLGVLACGGSAARAQSVLFSDDFSGDLSQWEVVAGRWEIRDGQLRGIGAGGGVDAWIYAGNETWKDYAVQTRAWASEETGNAEIVLRSTGHWQNEYRISVFPRPGNYSIEVYKNGHVTDQVVRPLPHTLTYPAEIRGEIVGGEVRLYVNGEFVGNMVDPHPLPAGRFALGVIGAGHSEFDYVTVAEHGCGNRVVQSALGEECDDGNLDSTDGCTNACTICGNGVVLPGEECDDGNLIDHDGCNADCRLPVCGDRIVDSGEQCDDGNQNDSDGCTNACTICGNGIVTPPERCDDGNLQDGDCCSSTCQRPAPIVTGPVVNPANHHRYLLIGPALWPASETAAVCLGGHLATINDQAEQNWVFDTFIRYGGIERILWIGLTDEESEGIFVWTSGEPVTYTNWGPGEPSDSGNEDYVHIGLGPHGPGEWNDAAGPEYDGVVELTDCGNGVVDADEECDDGNTDPSDGCTNACTSCGDGIIRPPETCDDGNLVNGDGCDANCTPTACGNGLPTAGEECDDGNPNDADGCTNACTLCGNGLVTPPEECDDGNLLDGDCCTPSCGPALEVITGPVVNPTTGHDYYLLQPASWPASEAQAVCLGGHLVTINDAAEENWVWGEFARFGGTDRSLWIGLTDVASEGTLVWSSGEPLTYTHWYPGEPNDCCSGQDYVHIYPPWDGRSSWWGDTDAAGWEGGEVHGVVEVAPPPPATPTPTPRPTADEGGCAVTPGVRGGAWWWFLPSVWLLGHRRRQRSGRTITGQHLPAVRV